MRQIQIVEETYFAVRFIPHVDVTRHITAFPRQFFGLPWRMDNAVIGGEILDGQRERVDVPLHARTSRAKWPIAEKTERGSLLNRPSCPSDEPIGQGT